MNNNLREQLEKIRTVPRKDLGESTREFLDDNDKAVAVLKTLQRQHEHLAERISEQIGVVNYTALKVVEHHKKAAESVSPDQQPTS